MTKGRSLLLFAVLLLMAACQKNTVSKIPFIALMEVTPLIHVNADTAFILFRITDGDADIGIDNNTSKIFVKDRRYDTLGYQSFAFPDIDPSSSEDPKKGLEGQCLFYTVPAPTPRVDSIHRFFADTVFYELYVTDRAGHESNHIVTSGIVIKP